MTSRSKRQSPGRFTRRRALGALPAILGLLVHTAACGDGPPPPCPGSNGDGPWRHGDPYTEENLYDVHGLAGDDVWAVGAGGTVRHFDGDDWRKVVTSTASDLHLVRSTGRREAVVLGTGTLLRCTPKRCTNDAAFVTWANTTAAGKAFAVVLDYSTWTLAVDEAGTVWFGRGVEVYRRLPAGGVERVATGCESDGSAAASGLLAGFLARRAGGGVWAASETHLMAHDGAACLEARTCLHNWNESDTPLMLSGTPSGGVWVWQGFTASHDPWRVGGVAAACHDGEKQVLGDRGEGHVSCDDQGEQCRCESGWGVDLFDTLDLGDIVYGVDCGHVWLVERTGAVRRLRVPPHEVQFEMHLEREDKEATFGRSLSQLNAIWGASGDDLWIVGDDGCVLRREE